MGLSKYITWAAAALFATTVSASAASVTFSGDGAFAYDSQQPTGPAVFGALVELEIFNTLTDPTGVFDYTYSFDLSIEGQVVADLDVSLPSSSLVDLLGDPFIDGFVVLAGLNSLDVSSGPATGTTPLGSFSATFASTVAGSNPATGTVLIAITDNAAGDLLGLFGPGTAGPLAGTVSGSLVAAAVPLPASGVVLLSAFGLLLLRRRTSTA